MRNFFISTRTLYGVYPLLLASMSYTQDFNSHPLRSVSLRWSDFCEIEDTFQLAPSTECIETGLMQATEISYFNSHPLRSVSEWSFLGGTIYLISTRTLYGVYRRLNKYFLSLCHFNSHPLRSVSCIGRGLAAIHSKFQLAPSTECISKIA